MNMKKWITGVAAAVLMSGVFALPQAMAGPVVINNNLSKAVNVIAYAGTAFTTMQAGANASKVDFTYLNDAITRIIVQFQAASGSWTTKTDYVVPSPAVNKAFTVNLYNEEVTIREQLPGQ